jgi:hypothetical protein
MYHSVTLTISSSSLVLAANTKSAAQFNSSEMSGSIKSSAWRHRMFAIYPNCITEHWLLKWLHKRKFSNYLHTVLVLAKCSVTPKNSISIFAALNAHALRVDDVLINVKEQSRRWFPRICSTWTEQLLAWTPQTTFGRHIVLFRFAHVCVWEGFIRAAGRAVNAYVGRRHTRLVVGGRRLCECALLRWRRRVEQRTPCDSRFVFS